MASNFTFLERYWPVLAQIGGLAETYLYTDPNACVYKLGIFAERVVQELLAIEKISPSAYDDTQVSRVKALKRADVLPRNIDDILYTLRTTRNQAVHSGLDSLDDAKTLLQMAYSLAAWFMGVYGDWGFVVQPFVMPVRPEQPDYGRLITEKESKINELLARLEEVQTAASGKPKEERSRHSQRVSENLNLSEAETRRIIDEQLRKVGWECDTVSLRYSKGTRPQKGRNIAIAEWPTDSRLVQGGHVDYALFAGLQLVGMVEAKKTAVDIPSVIDYQCKDYARSVRQEHRDYCIQIWGEYYVPFVFATNGRKYLKQLETKSGIWYLDMRDTSNIPKALQGWMSPDGMLELLEKDIAKGNRELQATPYDLLRDPDGLNLRYYQIDAIEAAEAAIRAGKRTALLSMATGTGKTRTVLGLIYRAVKSGRFSRVLFLVDRTALGEQAQEVFKEVKIEDLMTLDNIYNIKELGDKEIDKETKIHVATVQSLVKRLLYNEDDTIPSVTDYDLIVVDEAHRGYILDREIGDAEQLYRDQDDYISKYRTVIEYFDAVKIALTATPALHTTQIFGEPLFNYSYREAVIDGFLVDHDAPHDIHTRLRDEGIQYSRGEQLAIYDPVTGEVINSPALEDDMNFDVDTFNRQVVTENFNRMVLNEIAANLNPEGDGKTLIYAVDDNHADLIVKLLKEYYFTFGIDNEAVMKITGSVGGGNPKKVQEAIKRFKNERHPNIAVTVDLLTTGVDVPKITTLVFLRRVRSRILFEQMMGRATRLCPEIRKTHFEIYDPVGVYDALEPVNTMKPVVANPSATFDDLIDGLDVLESGDQVQNQVNLIIAKLQRQRRNLSERQLQHFIDLAAGKSPAQFIHMLQNLPIAEAKKLLMNSRELFRILNEGGLDRRRKVIIDHHEDELVSHTRGYGSGQKPQDYLDAFASFIKDNVNRIAALKTVCTRPAELTRESLKSLMLELDRHDFTEQQLNTAWAEMTNEDIAADIIGFIRQQALGSPLVNHEQRIRNAVERLIRQHSFNKMQKDWLRRIEKNLLEETVLDDKTFNMGAFKTAGGFQKIDKQFGGQLHEIIAELNSYLYEDGGQTA